MWVPTEDEAVLIYARFLKGRHGAAASKLARQTAQKLQDEAILKAIKSGATPERHKALLAFLKSAN